MTHKIKGWARDFTDHGSGYELGNGGGWAEFSEDGKEEFGDVPCTLVTTHERVFTEREVRAAAMAEPELPGEMPDEIWEACKSDRATMQEALRVVVRLTRDGILGRLLDPA